MNSTTHPTTDTTCISDCYQSSSPSSCVVPSEVPTEATPASNTASLNAFVPAGSVSVSVDWLSITDKSGELTPSQLLPWINPDAWVELGHGGKMYKRMAVIGNVKHYWDGADGMGQHFEISGQGCRELEGLGLTDWLGVFAYWRSLGVHFARHDFALDDRAGLLDIASMTVQAQSGHTTTKATEVTPIAPFEPGTGELTAHGLNFGKRSSRTYVRIYDKALERRRAIGVDDGKPWVRVEIQHRNERANAVIDLMIASGGLGAIAGVLREFLDFKDANPNDSTKTRWATSAFWSVFLGHAAKCRLVLDPKVASLADKMKHFERQYGPLLATFTMHHGGDLGPMADMVGRSHRRMKARHFALLVAA